MTLLILGGTAEARALADRLAGRDAVLSLAGAVRKPAAQGLPVRIGGFGGAEGFRAYLAERGIAGVLDATHPFAARITGRTAQLCADLGLPYCRLDRPEWQAEAGDNWTFIDGEAEAARYIPAGAHVFLATGRQTLDLYANLDGRRLTCRVIDPPDRHFPFEGGRWMTARPPFSVEDEIALFRLIAVNWLVVKNAGGQASRAKLDAARVLGLPVLVIRRPPPPPTGDRVADVGAALDWIDSHALA